MPSPGVVTKLLRAWSDGEDSALEELIPLVEAELRRLARGYMGRERHGHTLQTTALVNEAFVRLTDARRVRWNDRAQFLGISARLMRRVLVDYARRRGYHKRGGGAQRVTLHEGLVTSADPVVDVLALDRALEALANVDSPKSQTVELRFFGGLSVTSATRDSKSRKRLIRSMWVQRLQLRSRRLPIVRRPLHVRRDSPDGPRRPASVCWPSQALLCGSWGNRSTSGAIRLKVPGSRG